MITAIEIPNDTVKATKNIKVLTIKLPIIGIKPKTNVAATKLLLNGKWTPKIGKIINKKIAVIMALNSAIAN